MPRRYQDALRVLVAEIVCGERPEGAQLPREADLAEEFGISRGVVREVIRELENRRLVDVVHGKGATVLPATSWDLIHPDVLTAVLDSRQAIAVLGEYLECRRVTEIEAAGLAAERAQERDRLRLAEALDRMEQLAAGPSSPAAERLFHEADIAFHSVLIQAAGNRALASLVGRIHRALLTARFPAARLELRHQRVLPEHRRVLDAILDGDARAARRAMELHLETVAGYLQDYAVRNADDASTRSTDLTS